MGALLPILVTLAAGMCLAFQPATNAVLARESGSVILATLVSFVVGTSALFVLWLAIDRTPPPVRGIPAWGWLGGLYGAVFAGAMAFSAPRLGLASALTIAIASQLGAALVIDHFGWLQLPRNPLSVGRAAGVVLVLAGVWLVRRS